MKGFNSVDDKVNVIGAKVDRSLATDWIAGVQFQTEAEDFSVFHLV
jgi:hypothetical protein